MNKARRTVKMVGYKLAQMSEWGLPKDRLDLTGDRDVEWAWVAAKVPSQAGRVLDIGPATSFTPLVAAFCATEVIGFDLDPPPVPFAHPRLTYVRGDILRGGLPEGAFDTIINCSTTEHMGLSGRYGSIEEEDGDLRAMELLRERLSGPDARMIFTIPVGQDAVCRPFHRIYGEQRLPRVLNGFRVEEEAFFAKSDGINQWRQVPRTTALSVQGSASFYGLGLFVLKRA